jgi:hypothetical protein
MWYGESWYWEPTARTAKSMESQDAETGLVDLVEARAFFARSSR